MKSYKRRELLLGAGAMLTGCTGLSPQPNTANNDCDDWRLADQIVASLSPPVFPNRDFSILDYGAQPGGEQDSSKALALAIQACHERGGGRVIVPPGDYLCGPVHLLSNVNFHLVKGARLLFSTNPQDYLPAVFTRWEGMELMGYSPLIYAYQQSNVALTGEGVLDGQAARENWWAWKGNAEWGLEGHPSQYEGRKQLMADMAAGKPPRERHYSEGFYFRPPFVQFYECNTVLIEGVHIRRAPFWLVNPVLCDNVQVRGLRLESLGPNSDGCNPESCRNVLIENCYFDTGDDCIAIKSGRNEDGRRIAVPSERIVIRNCQMRAGHGGVVIGSEISGGARHIFAENCVMSSPDLERGLRIKTNSVRGGLIEHLRFRNIMIGQVRDAVVINFHYEEGDAGQFDPTVRDIQIQNLFCQSAKTVFRIRGFARAPIRELSFENAHFTQADQQGVIEYVEGLSLSGVSINGTPIEK